MTNVVTVLTYCMNAAPEHNIFYCLCVQLNYPFLLRNVS